MCVNSSQSDFGVQGVILLNLFSKISPLWPIRAGSFKFSWGGRGGGGERGVMCEYYQPHKCKHTLTDVSNSVQTPLTYHFKKAKSQCSHCYMHSKTVQDVLPVDKRVTTVHRRWA